MNTANSASINPFARCICVQINCVFFHEVDRENLTCNSKGKLNIFPNNYVAKSDFRNPHLNRVASPV